MEVSLISLLRSFAILSALLFPHVTLADERTRTVDGCSLCSDDAMVHDDHQHLLLFISPSETYTTCTDLALALLDSTTANSHHCGAMQSKFQRDCCTTLPSRSRTLFGTFTLSSWNTKPVPAPVPIASASIPSWPSGGWNPAPAPLSWGNNNNAGSSWSNNAGSSWNTASSNTSPSSFSSSSFGSLFNINVPKPTSGWWNNNPKPTPVASFNPPPVYVPPPPAPPLYRPPANPYVVHSNHPAWGSNNGVGGLNSKSPAGTTYLNDGYCGICTDPANGSLGIVVNGFGVADFAFTGK